MSDKCSGCGAYTFAECVCYAPTQLRALAEVDEDNAELFEQIADEIERLRAIVANITEEAARAARGENDEC